MRAASLLLVALAALPPAAAAAAPPGPLPAAAAAASKQDLAKLQDKLDVAARDLSTPEEMKPILAALGDMGKQGSTPRSEDPAAEDSVREFADAAQKVKEAADFAAEMKTTLEETAKSAAARGVEGALNATASAAVAVVGGIAVDQVRTQMKVRQATCAFDVTLATQYVVKSVLHIIELTKVCQPIEDPGYTGQMKKYVRSACRANAAGIFASITTIAAYLSIAASICGTLANIPALCAATIEALILGFAKIASAASIMHGVCGGGLTEEEKAALQHSHSDMDIWQITRRLKAADDSIDAMKRRLQDPGPRNDVQLTTCVIDTTLVATSLGQFALAFKETMFGCSLDQLTHPIPIVGPLVTDLCVADLGLVLYGFGTAASFIAASVAQCGSALNLDAMCIAAAEQVTASTAGLLFVGGGMDATCVRVPKLGPLGKVLIPLTALGRRLHEEETDYDSMSPEEKTSLGYRLLGLDLPNSTNLSGRDSMFI